ncbi:hypothetical protein BGW80DRAFT_1564651 [Lactifluus volemus]|nr:hypothetical protein BGW80DRAFT_1564651 [Lactifluus volemus]
MAHARPGSGAVQLAPQGFQIPDQIRALGVDKHATASLDVFGYRLQARKRASDEILDPLSDFSEKETTNLIRDSEKGSPLGNILRSPWKASKLNTST